MMYALIFLVWAVIALVVILLAGANREQPEEEYWGIGA